MTETHDTDATLSQWSRRLTQALQILDFEVDQELVARLARESSQHVADGAGPISTFVVGYAAGLKATAGKTASADAVATAAAVALQLAGDGTGAQTGHGWTDTAQ
ncbi:MAG TPA: DUF6457 domain-containing protein [Micrococcaceae bacterium]|jgi:uncharacterized protein YigA (DUF484 family)